MPNPYDRGGKKDLLAPPPLRRRTNRYTPTVEEQEKRDAERKAEIAEYEREWAGVAVEDEWSGDADHGEWRGSDAF